MGGLCMGDESFINELPYLIIENGKVIEVNSSFFDLTGYLECEIINKYASEVFKILRIAPNFDFNNSDRNTTYFIFSKNLNYRTIKIFVEGLSDSNKIICKFSEKENSRFEDNFKYLNNLCQQDIMGMAIFSVSEFILLKANQKYLNCFEKEFNCLGNVFGKQIFELCTTWRDSKYETICKNIIDTGKSVQLNECLSHNQGLATTYLKVYITPVEENGLIKYLVVNAIDVTKEVSEKKEIEKTMKIQEECFSFITHELRTPLTTISATIQLLESVYKKEISGKLNK